MEDVPGVVVVCGIVVEDISRGWKIFLAVSGW